VFFNVLKKEDLCLNKPSLAALLWRLSKYLPLALMRIKRYCVLFCRCLHVPILLWRVASCFLKGFWRAKLVLKGILIFFKRIT